MRFFGIRLRMRLSYVSDAVRRMLSSGMEVEGVQVAGQKAHRNCANAWQSLIETLRIEGSGTGVAVDQCSAGIICNNQSTDLFSDMLIPTEVDQQKMLMAVRMQQAIRLGMVESKQKSAMSGMVINRVRMSCNNS